MNPLRTLDDQAMLAVNSFARHTGWLHAPVLAYRGVRRAAVRGAPARRDPHQPRRRHAHARGGRVGLRRDAPRRRGQPAGGAPVRRGPPVRDPPGPAPARGPDPGLLLPLRPRRHGRRGDRRPAAGVPPARAGGRGRRAGHGVLARLRRGALPVGRRGRPGPGGRRGGARLAAAAATAHRADRLAAQPARGACGVRRADGARRAYGGVPSGVQEDLATGGGAGRA